MRYQWKKLREWLNEIRFSTKQRNPLFLKFMKKTSEKEVKMSVITCEDICGLH